MHFLLCIVYFYSLSLWKLIGKFRFLKINKGEGQNFLVYFDIPANHAYVCCSEKKKEAWKLDMFDCFLNLSIYIFCYFFIVATRLVATSKHMREINGRKLRIHSFIQEIVFEHPLWPGTIVGAWICPWPIQTQIPKLRSLLLYQGGMSDKQSL